MDFSINERLKQCRHALKLSQKKFASGIFLKSSGYLGDIEINRHEVNERVMELVASVYGVNKEWLKTGKGAMFSGERKIDTQLEEMNILFNQLNPHFKAYVLTQIKQLIKLQNVKEVEPPETAQEQAKPAPKGKKTP
jgi:transcriptional regulator with XRE-family HTH domain